MKHNIDEIADKIIELLKKYPTVVSFDKTIDEHKHLILLLKLKDKDLLSLNVTSMAGKLPNDYEEHLENLVDDIYSSVSDNDSGKSLSDYYVELRPQSKYLLDHYNEELEGEVLENGRRVTHMDFSVPLIWSLSTEVTAMPIIPRHYEIFGFLDNKTFWEQIRSKYLSELYKYNLNIIYGGFELIRDGEIMRYHMLTTPNDRLVEFLGGPYVYSILQKVVGIDLGDEIYVFPITRQIVLIGKNININMRQAEITSMTGLAFEIFDYCRDRVETSIFSDSANIGKISYTAEMERASKIMTEHLPTPNITYTDSDRVIGMRVSDSDDLAVGYTKSK